MLQCFIFGYFVLFIVVYKALNTKVRTSILAGSNGIGGKNTGEDFTFGSRERKTEVQTTNID